MLSSFIRHLLEPACRGGKGGGGAGQRVWNPHRQSGVVSKVRGMRPGDMSGFACTWMRMHVCCSPFTYLT